jgi:hypothetical protein
MMEKSIKDYLHLYLGCKVYDTKAEPNDCISTMTTVSNEGYIIDNFANDLPVEDIKPILRPLSDMTDDDFKYCGQWGFGAINLEHKLLHKTFSPEATVYLLSKHFDLFQLIEAGLAIDATTLNQTT